MDYNKIGKNVYKLVQEKSSTKIVFEALKILGINKKSALRKIIFIILEVSVSIVIANSLETIGIIKNITEYIGQIQVGMIGIVFTGYALFQALISDKLLLYLLSEEEERKSKLEESNESFIYLIIVQIITVLLDLFIYIFMCAIPDDWHLTSVNCINVIMALIGIVIILYLNVEAIWELKSFIFNVYQLFNAHAMARVIDIIEKEEKENH